MEPLVEGCHRGQANRKHENMWKERKARTGSTVNVRHMVQEKYTHGNHMPTTPPGPKLMMEAEALRQHLHALYAGAELCAKS